MIGKSGVRLILRVTEVPAAIFQRRLIGLPDRGQGAALVGRDFKAIPMLLVIVAQFDIAAGEVGDRDRRDDRFIGDVLQTLEFQIHLDLSLRRENERKSKGRPGSGSLARKIPQVAMR